MAQALYLSESDENYIILNQREQYGEVQIALMKRNKGLQRGGGVMEDTELSGLVRGFLNRQGGMNITVTESMLNEIGAYMAATMRDINYAQKSGNLRNETLHRWKLLSAARVLETLGIPYQRELTGRGEYVSATICGVTFSTEMEAD